MKRVGEPDETPQGATVPAVDEEVVVAQLAACEAAISHLWDVAGFFEMDQCNRIRDIIHRLNKLTLPSIRDLKAPSGVREGPQTPFAALKGALRGEESDEDFDHAVAGVREGEGASRQVTVNDFVCAVGEMTNADALKRVKELVRLSDEPDWVGKCPRCNRTVLNHGDMCSHCEAGTSQPATTARVSISMLRAAAGMLNACAEHLEPLAVGYGAHQMRSIANELSTLADLCPSGSVMTASALAAVRDGIVSTPKKDEEETDHTRPR